jgi:hypothetical protein
LEFYICFLQINAFKTQITEIYRGYDNYKCRLVTYRVTCRSVDLNANSPLMALSIAGSVPMQVKMHYLNIQFKWIEEYTLWVMSPLFYFKIQKKL